MTTRRENLKMSYRERSDRRLLKEEMLEKHESGYRVELWRDLIEFDAEGSDEEAEQEHSGDNNDKWRSNLSKSRLPCITIMPCVKGLMRIMRFSSLGLKPSEDQIEKLIQKADPNNNGLVEFSEFVGLVDLDIVKATSPYSEQELQKLFNIVDRDGNGYITAAELAHSVAKLGQALTTKELTGMIKEADTDGTGCINFQGFSRANF
ncbi:EF-hand domain [Dillenia turbinata]|uniref:EF-hand domain n=1 Tax=Dillenia turbinata TaxID=194707 RepID=A0AAN8VM04_9MAGN